MIRLLCVKIKIKNTSKINNIQHPTVAPMIVGVLRLFLLGKVSDVTPAVDAPMDVVPARDMLKRGSLVFFKLVNVTTLGVDDENCDVCSLVVGSDTEDVVLVALKPKHKMLHKLFSHKGSLSVSNSHLQLL